METTNGPLPSGDGQYEIAICTGDNLGYVLRANCSVDTSDSPPWIKRLIFYVESRLAGHTADYLTQGIKEEAEGTNITLPFGFPKALKETYYIPSKMIEEDTFELDRLEVDLPQVKGLINVNQLWLVCDGQFAWIYWFDIGEPFSQRRDPKEYDPKFRMEFDAATKEAWNVIKERKINTDIHVPLDEEVQRILKQKYGIDWVTPSELN